MSEHAETAQNSNGGVEGSKTGEFELPPAKRQRTETASSLSAPTEETKEAKSTVAGVSDTHVDGRDQQKGVAAIKAEYLLPKQLEQSSYRDDDEAEASKPSNAYADGDVGGGKGGRGKKNKHGGQNKNRQFGIWKDKIQLCNTRALSSEFSPEACRFGDKCKLEHNLRKYLKDGKSDDLDTFEKCPVLEEHGFCTAGWKCRFVGTHSKEIDHEDGRKELVLLQADNTPVLSSSTTRNEESGIHNVVPMQDKIDLSRRRVKLDKSDQYIQWLDTVWKKEMDIKHNNNQSRDIKPRYTQPADEAAKTEDTKMEDTPDTGTTMEAQSNAEKLDNAASYTEPPFRASEKRRIYYGPETPVLAPLTTQGNLPFRRLCVELGAQATFSEMAMGLPLIQGEKSEWALMRAHESEVAPPTIGRDVSSIVSGYDPSKDLRFGVQVAAPKPWIALKTTEVLAKYCSSIRAIDLNCGCPIDLVYKSGAGSALLDAPSKLEKILRGMNALSGEIPITAKIRTGTRDSKPTAHSLVKRLILGSSESQDAGLGPSGVAAITLHGRSRQQRYTRSADWSYIAEVGSMVKRLQADMAEQTDTARDVDARDLPNGGRVFFLGNGDVFSHVDYTEHLVGARVDACMVGRGALVKPWLFEEIAAGQYLDKSSSERLEYIRTFVRHGLNAWGADEVGVSTTRRFLLEWLSFSCRYVPLGLLERLPPRLNERPPAFRGRDDLETLLASGNYKDWIKLSEMFLGKPNEGFNFTPKHKSNAYETEG